MHRTIFLVLLLCLGGVSLVVAQNDVCPSLVQSALDLAHTNCSGLSRNQACYGNVQINIVPAADAGSFVFEQPGDTVSVANIQTLRLSNMVTPNEWGVALLSIQANLPDTLPGQNVTVVLFGDVTIDEGGTVPNPTLNVTANQGMNVRSGPGTNYSVVSGLSTGDVLTAEGRNEAGDWVRVQLPDDGGSGWLYVPLITVDGDVNTLAVVDASISDTAGTVYGPMQAFSFTSGTGVPLCREAPLDGLLVQTPKGAGQINLLINEVQISLGSTAFMQAVPGDHMTIALLEGQAQVTTQDGSAVVPAGSQAMIPLDTDGNAAGAPVVQPLDEDRLTGLPLSLLAEGITVAAPLTQDELDNLRFGIQGGVWASSVGGTDTDFQCTANTLSYSEPDSYRITIKDGTLSFSGVPTTMNSDGTFVAERTGNVTGCDSRPGGICAVETWTYTLHVVSAEEIAVSRHAFWDAASTEGRTCTQDIDYTLTYSGEG